MKISTIAAYILMMGYILGIKDGYIALWKDGKAQPTVYPYRAEMLPAEDQQRLKNGIRVESKAELIRLVEDYLS